MIAMEKKTVRDGEIESDEVVYIAVRQCQNLDRQEKK